MRETATIATRPRIDHRDRPVHYVVWLALPGGMESYVTAYVDQFKATRDTHIFSLRPSTNELSDGVVGYQQGSNSAWALYSSYYRYCRQHRQGQFHLLNSGAVVLLLTLLAGVRRPVYHIHGTRYWKTWKDRWFLRLAWLLALPFKVVYIANSNYSAGIFRRNAVPVAPEVVYNGFDTERFLAGRSLRTTLGRMSYVGRLELGKNVHQVIDIFNSVAAEYPGLELHIVGSGSLEHALREQALASPYRRRVFFHGWIADVSAFYSTSDLMIFPSSYESFGNVLAEGLLNGLPVLVSDIPVFDEIHQDPGTFCIGSPDDPKALIARARASLANFPELAAKAYTASDRVAKAFSMTDHLAAIEQAYERR